MKAPGALQIVGLAATGVMAYEAYRAYQARGDKPVTDVNCLTVRQAETAAWQRGAIAAAIFGVTLLTWK